MRAKTVGVLIGVLIAGAANAQMSDRPVVARSKTSVQQLAGQRKITAARLAQVGPTGTGLMVWRMRTATGRLVHEFKTTSARLTAQRKVHFESRLMAVFPHTTFVLVMRRRLEEPLFGQRRTATARIVDQFPTYTDFTR